MFGRALLSVRRIIGPILTHLCSDLDEMTGRVVPLVLRKWCVLDLYSMKCIRAIRAGEIHSDLQFDPGLMETKSDRWSVYNIEIVRGVSPSFVLII